MPTTSPRTLSSGPPELPGLIAASVCSMCCSRPATPPERTAERADDADGDRVARPNGLPIAITQSPGCICAESPNFASCSGVRRHLGELDQRAVGQRVVADHLGRVGLGPRPSPKKRDRDLRRRLRRRGCW